MIMSVCCTRYQEHYEIQQDTYMKSRLIHLHVSLATLATGQCLCMEEREVTNFYNISCEPGTALHPADPDPENFISHFITGFPRLGQYLILTRQQ